MRARETEDAPKRRDNRFRDVLLGGGHLAVLSAFALAQPLFDLLSRYAEFFAVRGSTSWDIILFALALTLVPPAAMLALEMLAWVLAAPVQRILHLVFVSGLAGVFFIQLLKKTVGLSSTILLIGGAGLLGVLLAFGYARARPIRSILTVLVPAPAVFLLLFLFASPVSKLVLPAGPEAQAAAVSSQAPVVFVVFDELPVNTLMGPGEKIDAARFPHFAELAQDSTWFRNTTTVSWFTTWAVPAILTGRNVSEDKLPVASDHPRSLYTLLGESYRMNVDETYIHLCPKSLCGGTQQDFSERTHSLYSDVGIVYLHLLAPPKYEARLPATNEDWMNFGEADKQAEQNALVQQAAKGSVTRSQRNRYIHPLRGLSAQARRQFFEQRVKLFEQFVASVRPTERPSLNFIHVLVPHVPWRYFPSGRQSTSGVGYSNAAGPPAVRQLQQRHILQTQFVDSLVGELVDRLRKTGLYDKSLVVLTADHGISFRPGEPRRGVTATNMQDLAFVPLFVKRPGQKEAEVVDRHTQTIDILPTIAEALGVRIPWHVDGRSGYDSAARPDQVTLKGVSASFEKLLARRRVGLREQLRVYGFGGDELRVFRVGPHAELIGRRVDELRMEGPSGATASIDGLERKLLRDLPENAVLIPSPIQGSLVGAGAVPGRAVAVAVNGKVAAICISTRGPDSTRFSALVPEPALRTGRNRVEFFFVDSSGPGLVLRRIASG